MGFDFISLKISSLASSTMVKYLCYFGGNLIEFLYSHTEMHFFSDDSDIEVTHD
jgi:hypothetical protein